MRTAWAFLRVMGGPGFCHDGRGASSAPNLLPGEPPIDPVRILPSGRTLGEGESRRFTVRVHGIERDAFAVGYRGRAYAYLNTCRHQAQNLDFGDGHFFDEAFDALVCCHHGARYAVETGVCVEGPCEGARLTALVLEQRDDGLWCTDVSAPPASSPTPSRRAHPRD